MRGKPYQIDLSDAEWTELKQLLPAEQNRIGSPREVELREVVNALMYMADNGIKWRAMPHDFPAWQTVYGYFRALEPKWGVGASKSSIRSEGTG